MDEANDDFIPCISIRKNITVNKLAKERNAQLTVVSEKGRMQAEMYLLCYLWRSNNQNFISIFFAFSRDLCLAQRTSYMYV